MLFSALLKQNSVVRQKLFSQKDVRLYACKFSIIELFRHKERLIESAKLSEEEILEVYYAILKKIRVYDEELVSDANIERAMTLCKDIDEKDMIFVAAALEMGAELWTGDMKLKEGLLARGFTAFYVPTE